MGFLRHLCLATVSYLENPRLVPSVDMIYPWWIPMIYPLVFNSCASSNWRIWEGSPKRKWLTHKKRWRLKHPNWKVLKTKHLLETQRIWTHNQLTNPIIPSRVVNVSSSRHSGNERCQKGVILRQGACWVISPRYGLSKLIATEKLLMV